MKLLDRLSFWLWHKEIALRLKDNIGASFAWTVRVETVYKPLFEAKGLQAVYEEHKEHVERITAKFD